MKDTELVNELFELWKNLGEVGELHIVKGYSDRLQMLQERVNKYNSLHNVSKPLPKGVNIKVAETSRGIEFSQYEYDEWQKSDIDNLDDFLEQELC